MWNFCVVLEAVHYFMSAGSPLWTSVSVALCKQSVERHSDEALENVKCSKFLQRARFIYMKSLLFHTSIQCEMRAKGIGNWLKLITDIALKNLFICNDEWYFVLLVKDISKKVCVTLSLMSRSSPKYENIFRPKEMWWMPFIPDYTSISICLLLDLCFHISLSKLHL